jgi:hypothetical protein
MEYLVDMDDIESEPPREYGLELELDIALAVGQVLR